MFYPIYGVVWIWSIYIQYQEYKKGIPHAWYSHKMFWGLNCISYSSNLGVILATDFLADFEDKWPPLTQFYIICSFGSLAMISLILFCLGLCAKNEFNLNENLILDAATNLIGQQGPSLEEI